MELHQKVSSFFQSFSFYFQNFPLAGLKPTKLDSDEQAKIAKVGLEMKLVTSEMDAEAEKWDEPQNEIAKVCFVFFSKNKIYLFS
jgi:hypothetical protein